MIARHRLDGQAFLTLLDRVPAPHSALRSPEHPLTLRHLAKSAQAVLRRYRGTWVALAGARTVTQHASTRHFVLRQAGASAGSTPSIHTASLFLRHLPIPTLIVLPPRAGRGLRHAVRPGEASTLCGKSADLWMLDTKGGDPGCTTCLRISSIASSRPIPHGRYR